MLELILNFNSFFKRGNAASTVCAVVGCSVIASEVHLAQGVHQARAVHLASDGLLSIWINGGIHAAYG